MADMDMNAPHLLNRTKYSDDLHWRHILDVRHRRRHQPWRHHFIIIIIILGHLQVRTSRPIYVDSVLSMSVITLGAMRGIRKHVSRDQQLAMYENHSKCVEETAQSAGQHTMMTTTLCRMNDGTLKSQESSSLYSLFQLMDSHKYRYRHCQIVSDEEYLLL